MFSQYFGNYLLEQELLTPNELKHVLNRKNGYQMKLGAFAVQKKYLTYEQAEYIHRFQGNSDMKFGELAVRCGLLTEYQLRELLKSYKSEYYLLCQILVDEGYFTSSQVSTILDNYRAELGLSKYEFEALKNNDMEKILNTFTKLHAVQDSYIYSDYVSLFFRNIVRFIDNDINLSPAEEIKEYEYRWLVYQNIYGEMDLFTGFATNDAGILELGCRFAHKTISVINDYILSSACEFINLQNGLFLSRLSEEGIEPCLQVQECKSEGWLTSSDTLIKIPFQLSFGKFDFLISDRMPRFTDNEEMITAVSAGRGI